MSARPGGVGKVFLAAPLDQEDLDRFATERDVVFWDKGQGCAVARREKRIGNLVIDSRPLSEGVREQLVQVIVDATMKDGTALFDFNDAVQNLQRRVAAVAAWHPELELPDLATEAVLGRAGEWVPLFIGKASSVAQLKKIDLTTVLWSLLSYEQQQAVPHESVNSKRCIGPQYIFRVDQSRDRADKGVTSKEGHKCPADPFTC